ncbi:hypothetical protein GC174_10890 [bacterium]|nr:hypothetical protein [bacterium]
MKVTARVLNSMAAFLMLLSSMFAYYLPVYAASEHCIESSCCIGQDEQANEGCCCVEKTQQAPVEDPVGLNFSFNAPVQDSYCPRTDSIRPSLVRLLVFDMVGRTSGLAKAAPPPVKLFIFKEAYLC